MDDRKQSLIDIDKDGKISEKELEMYKKKTSMQRNLAFLSMASILGMALWIGYYAPVERLAALNGLLDLFWVIAGGIVATYMGSEAYARR
jgi:hypothetical protein